jgi:two-component system chemotaxis response regulator CheY
MQDTLNGEGASGTVLQLPGQLDSAAAEGFLDLMRRHVAGAEPLRIDASQVETLTYSCAQIMLAAIRSHGHLSIEHPSEAFMAAFAELGIDWHADADPDLVHDSPQQPALNGSGVLDEASHADPQPCNGTTMSKRILTIDDSKTMRDMLMLTLADAGFDVLQAVDGEDGLDVLCKERVDVVITDINMPKMDGYGVIRHMRDKPEHKSTPILVLTTESELEKKNRAREAGATGWMVKPFDPDRLIATIRKVSP